MAAFLITLQIIGWLFSVVLLFSIGFTLGESTREYGFKAFVGSIVLIFLSMVLLFYPLVKAGMDAEAKQKIAATQPAK